MSSTAAFLPLADLADQQAGDAQYYRGVLHELIDIGVELARTVRKQASLPADDAGAVPVHDTAAAFDRISCAVRRTVALARKVAEPLSARESAGQKRAAARRRILREVEDAIQRTPEVDTGALRAELCERLDGSYPAHYVLTGRAHS